MPEKERAEIKKAEEERQGDEQVEQPGLFTSEPLELRIPEAEPPASESASRWAAVSGVIPGGILVILSVLYLLANYGILKGDWWQYFLALLLIVFLIEYWVEYISPVKGRSRLGMAVVGLLLIGVGVLFLFNPNVWWPLVLLAVGLALIVVFCIKRRCRGLKTAGSDQE